jgi:hypothetical protein
MINQKLNGLQRMSNYLPAGSDRDPRAPWNYEDLCRNCDKDIIRDIADQEATNSDRNYDEVLESMLEDACLCKECYKEEMADDDWANWRD